MEGERTKSATPLLSKSDIIIISESAVPHLHIVVTFEREEL